MISVWVNEWGHEKEETNKQTIGSTDKRLMEWMNAWIDLGIKTLYNPGNFYRKHKKRLVFKIGSCVWNLTIVSKIGL